MIKIIGSMFIGFTLFAMLSPVCADEPRSVAHLIIYRYMDAAVGRKPSVHIDGRDVVRLPRKKYCVIDLAPGRHIITGEKNENGIELDVEAGRTYYVRGSMQAVSVWARPHLMVFLVAPEQGEQDVKALEQFQER